MLGTFSRHKNSILPALLIIISVGVLLLNYTNGTWLSGWDTLHPEFNFQIYFHRIFWGVWQEHQGLGAVAAQAHASEIGRLWYLILGGIFLPLELFRWGYFGICLVLGPIGIYYFLRKTVSSESAFLGGMFYLFNLGTVQHFYLPLEMFATAYAFLPWLFWAVVSKRLVWLAILFFLAAPMAHTPTLFFASFAGLCLFALVLDPKWGIKTIIVGLLVNSFWLLPSLYFITNHAGDVVNSHISQQFTHRAVLANKEFANIIDLALIKGFLFDWGHFDFLGKTYTDVLPAWINHLKNPVILLVGYGIFVSVIFGVVITVKKKIKTGFAMGLVLILACIAILDFIPLPPGVLSESLRFPFTKFSILLMVAFAFFFSLALEQFGRWKRPLLFVVSIALIFYALPMFTGNLICPCVRVNFPTDYKQVSDWFNQQNKDLRIAPIPMDSIYGWGYYGWGYEGAGFRWFGISQPILDREFDRWMSSNENFYWEASYALYSKNLGLLENVLEKYRVSFLFLDENIINPQSPKALFFDEFKELIEKSDKFSLVSEFNKISVIRFKLDRPTKNYVSIVSELPKIGPEYKWGNFDSGFSDYGDYEFGNNVNYSYRTLFTGKRQQDIEFEIGKLAGGSEQVYKIYRECVEDLGETRECATIFLPELNHANGYIISVESENIEGLPLAFWVENVNSRKSDVETYLPKGVATSKFILPPMARDGLGYTVHFDSVSVGKERTVNKVNTIKIAPFDYFDMTSQKVGDATPVSYLSTDSFDVSHPNSSWFKVDLRQSGGNVVLAQSFENGWIAFDQDLKILNHVKINNWANGWKLQGNEKIVYIFFWPQILEFIGIGLLFMVFFFVLWKGKIK